MRTPSESNFKRKYQTYLKHLKLKRVASTIDVYVHAIRCIGAYFRVLNRRSVRDAADRLFQRFT